jgi:hypothetical protein
VSSGNSRLKLPVGETARQLRLTRQGRPFKGVPIRRAQKTEGQATATGPAVLGRTLEKSDWVAVVNVLRSIQSPASLDPNWVEMMPEDFEAKAEAARMILLTAQVEPTEVPDDVWGQILPTSRAALLRNTITQCLSAYRRSK